MYLFAGLFPIFSCLFASAVVLEASGCLVVDHSCWVLRLSAIRQDRIVLAHACHAVLRLQSTIGKAQQVGRLDLDG
jgi:hypothetical protein